MYILYLYISDKPLAEILSTAKMLRNEETQCRKCNVFQLKSKS